MSLFIMESTKERRRTERKQGDFYRRFFAVAFLRPPYSLSVFSVMKKGLSTGEMPGFYHGDYRVRDTWRFGERRILLFSVVFPVFASFSVKRRWKMEDGRWKDSFRII